MSLVGHWKLDELSGTTIKDSAGSNDGSWVGTELITDGAMTDTANWIDPGTWTVAGNIATRTANATNLTLTPASALSLTVGKAYTISFTLASTAGSISITSLDGTQTLATYVNGVDGDGTKTISAVLIGDDLIDFTADATFAGTIDNVSIREVVDSVLGPVGVKTALLFDGVGDYIDTGATFQSTFRDSFSISMWFKTDDGIPANEIKFFGASESPAEDNVFIRITTSGALGGTYEADGDKVQATVSSAFSNGPQPWVHVVFTATSGENARFYINGLIRNTSDASGITFADYTSAYNPYIGAFNNAVAGADDHFAGKIDDVRIYNEALSAAQIHQLWNEGVRAGYRGRGRGRNR